jgi:UPF0716 family protein affecting phage T7 exclusion
MLLALASVGGGAPAVASGPVIGLLATLLVMGISARINMMAATRAGGARQPRRRRPRGVGRKPADSSAWASGES